MSQHKWTPDGHDKFGNPIERCSACSIRKIETCSTFWQRKKGMQWIVDENEDVPMCLPQSASKALGLP